MKDKKLIISTIIGISFLLVLIFGATYAYFTVTVTDSFGTSKIEANINNLGTVVLKSKNNLKINLMASDMMKAEEDIVYYASKDGKTTTPTSEKMGEATVQGPGLFSCNYTIELDDNTSSMYDAFQKMSTKSAGQIVLTVNGEVMDFNTEGLFPKTISGTMVGVSSTSPQYITAQLKIVNESDINQSGLVGTSLEIGITTKEFTCEALPTENPVLAIQSDNLSSELLGGLFRFQGTAAEVNDNYFCFGDNLTDCTSEDAPVTRIIGITPSGQLKLIWPMAISNLSWYSEAATGITWEKSQIYSTLQLLKTEFPAEIVSLVEEYNWKYGDLTVEDAGGTLENQEAAFELLFSLTAHDFASLEGSFTQTVQSHLGLLYIHDFMYQKKSGKCISYDANSGNIDYECADGWLTLPDAEGEWTLTSYSTMGAAWGVEQGSMALPGDITYSVPVRPVLYLKAGFDIVGKGTVDNPYRFASVS